MFLLVEIFHDFTCQDLPPAIKDAYDEFSAPGRGWFQAFQAHQVSALLNILRPKLITAREQTRRLDSARVRAALEIGSP
ncbi:hypothetical protein BD779DRAFT_1565875 [Infundibulicybe gibba]|nr:hypothetical protein BD779DRAFT_1565875 [Infundibulicybe gibba]